MVSMASLFLYRRLSFSLFMTTGLFTLFPVGRLMPHLRGLLLLKFLDRPGTPRGEPCVSLIQLELGGGVQIVRNHPCRPSTRSSLKG